MKTSTSAFSRYSPVRGSALISVLVFGFALALIATSVLVWSTNETKVSLRNTAWLEARNAAEAVAEYGAAQVVAKFNTSLSPDFTDHTLNTPPASFFAGSRVDTSSLEAKAGNVVNIPAGGGFYYVDPTDATNADDSFRFQRVRRRDVTVVAKATVVDPRLGSVTAYVKEVISIRGSGFYNYAIFYSDNDLELHPISVMDIWGPVHVNGNLFVGPVSGNQLSFHGPVTASGHIFHAWRDVTTAAAREGGGSDINNSTAVNFAKNAAGTTASMRDSSSVWHDSTNAGTATNTAGLTTLLASLTAAKTASFVNYAKSTWGSYVKTSAMGVQPYNPIGMGEQVGVSGTTPILGTDDAADALGYGPHSLIEPSAPLPPTSDPYYKAKAAIEQVKFANQAGLYLRVTVTPGSGSTPDSATLKLYGDPHSGTGTSSDGPNGGVLLGTVPANVINFIAYKTDGSNNVTQGMYDRRQAKGVNLVQLNVANLRQALVDMAGSTTTSGTTIYKVDNTTKWGAGDGYDTLVSTSSGWNGGIYVQVDQGGSSKHTAVILAGGKTASATSSMVPKTNNKDGLTVATNAPVYILGHYNADGAVTTSSTQFPDDGKDGSTGNDSAESPCSVAADAVTILSPDYFGTSATQTVPATTSSGTRAYKSRTDTRTYGQPTGSSVEVATAIVAGSNATTTTTYSGGAHNLPRFLEDWTGNTIAIRGSLVSLYKSKVATGAWNVQVYFPGSRQWGFDKIFSNGHFPPMTPLNVSPKRYSVTYVNATTYASLVAGL